MELLDFDKIQKRIDIIDNTKWYQANACYPVTFFYTKEKESSTDLSIDSFLRQHSNNARPSKKEDPVLGTNLLSTPKTLKDYIATETKLSTTGEPASDTVLAYFSKISGLKTPNIPVAKNNGMLTASKHDWKDSTVTLEFICDREFKVLKYLQAWQSRWFVFDWQKHAFADKSNQEDKAGDNKIVVKYGGEGFLGLANCSVDINGQVNVLSHLSLFGLIPKTITPPSEVGPQTNPSGLPKIQVVCTYAHAILVYPATDSKLNFFYFN